MEPVLAVCLVVSFYRRRCDLGSSGARMSRSASRRRGEISHGSQQSHRGVILLLAGYAELP